jgi:PAS domain S-box-containing protein
LTNQLQLPDNPTVEQLKGLLQESETRFSALADASPVMIWMTDPDNRSYYFNKAWLDFKGKSLEQETGAGWQKGLHPDDVKAFNSITDLIKRKEKYTYEYRLLRGDGNYRTVFEVGNPRFLPDGSFAGYMGSCMDITETKIVKNELANQTKELLRSNEELEQFAYVASHDLQEPLRMIISYVQIIQKNIEQNNTNGLDEFMNYVLDGTGRMQSLINDLLQFSRVNRKGSVFSVVDMNEILKIATSHLTARISENNATVTYGDMPKVKGDTSQLIRLFQNLIDNAIKFKAPDRQPEIKISVEERAEDFVFSIKDNGIGIEDKFYNRIFVIFQRLHTRNEYAGTGIGLAVCKKIVERHGGEIWVESKRNEGSNFFFSIKK